MLPTERPVIYQPPEDNSDPRSHKRATTLVSSFRYALTGLVYVLRTQRNARIHAAVTVATIAAGAILRLGNVEWAILALAIGGVFTCEIFNTVVETTVDLASPEFHPLAARAKDVAAAAVLVASLAAATIGLVILGPRLWTAISLLLA